MHICMDMLMYMYRFMSVYTIPVSNGHNYHFPPEHGGPVAGPEICPYALGNPKFPRQNGDTNKFKPKRIRFYTMFYVDHISVNKNMYILVYIYIYTSI